MTAPIASSPALEAALQHLDAALGQLEAAAQRKLEMERSRGDLQTELAIMQDDRARLAVDLDGALTRVATVEAAARHAGERLERALATVAGLMAAQPASERA